MDNPQQVNLTVKHSPWIQGYIDALNNTINIQAYETDKDYEDGYETAAVAEFKYTEQFIRGESNDF
jgi:hypothetical protein